MNAEAMREEMLRLTAFRSIAATIPARPITESPYARWVAREAEALERERQRLQAGLHVRLDAIPPPPLRYRCGIDTHRDHATESSRRLVRLNEVRHPHV